VAHRKNVVAALKIRPIGVVIIAMVLAIAGLTLLIPGVALCFSSVKVNLGLELDTAGKSLAWHPDRARLLAFCLVNGAIFAVVAVGLFRLKNWARIAAQILLVVCLAVGVLISLPPPRPKATDAEAQLAFLLLTALAIWYLRRPAVKDRFRAAETGASLHS
jgi:lysylphosphatidylglycerol synthetase-like protein (DUF2156 family)